MKKLILMLLRVKPYTVALNSSKFNALRINLSPLCGFSSGDKVYQVRRDDGVLEVVPEEVFNNDPRYSELKPLQTS